MIFHDLTHQPWYILDFKFPWICNDLIQKSFRTFLNPHSGDCLSRCVGRPAVARPSACLSAPGCNATGRTGLHWLRPNAVVRPPGKPVKLQLGTANVKLIMFLFDPICTWLILNMLKNSLFFQQKVCGNMWTRSKRKMSQQSVKDCTLERTTAAKNQRRFRKGLRMT